MSIIRNPEATRARLLTAALSVLQARGPLHFTLDEVARQAQTSKGGLLHHFPSKEALLEALLRQILEAFTAAVEVRLADEPISAGRLLRAYVHTCLAATDTAPAEVAALVLAAMANQTTLTEIVRTDALAWHERLSQDGLPPARVAVIRMAADQYWADRLLNVAPEGAARDALMAELYALTQAHP